MGGYTNYGNQNLPAVGLGLFSAKALSLRPHVFVSYYHREDQEYYDAFSHLFDGVYDLIIDDSLDEEVDTDDMDYVRRSIRENNIAGTSITLVLFGANTHKRRWIDWEIQMTLNKEHALLAIILPTNATVNLGKKIINARMNDNLKSGYAHWIDWTENPKTLQIAMAAAKEKAKNKSLIRNSAPAMQRSKP